MSNVLNLWAILALPLFITLETALLAQTEHSEKHWKHLFALAVPRWVYYAAKWLTGAALVFLGQVFLLGGTLLSGYLMRLARPDLGFDAYPPVAWMARILGLVYLISLLVLSIHTWVALHFHSFTVAVGVGMAAAVANIILINSTDGQRYLSLDAADQRPARRRWRQPALRPGGRDRGWGAAGAAGRLGGHPAGRAIIFRSNP